MGQAQGADSALIPSGYWIYAGLMDQQRQGLLKGLLAAVTFGLSAPLISTLTSSGSPLALAGLLYGGSALALLAARIVRGQSNQESPVKRQDLGMLTLLTLTSDSCVVGWLLPVLLQILGRHGQGDGACFATRQWHRNHWSQCQKHPLLRLPLLPA
jgi:hypothetical protein